MIIMEPDSPTRSGPNPQRSSWDSLQYYFLPEQVFSTDPYFRIRPSLAVVLPIFPDLELFPAGSRIPRLGLDFGSDPEPHLYLEGFESGNDLKSRIKQFFVPAQHREYTEMTNGAKAMLSLHLFTKQHLTMAIFSIFWVPVPVYVHLFWQPARVHEDFNICVNPCNISRCVYLYKCAVSILSESQRPSFLME